jgi:hypothetical protein
VPSPQPIAVPSLLFSTSHFSCCTCKLRRAPPSIYSPPSQLHACASSLALASLPRTANPLNHVLGAELSDLVLCVAELFSQNVARTRDFWAGGLRIDAARSSKKDDRGSLTYCSPRTGGAKRTGSLSPSYITAGPTNLTLPALECYRNGGKGKESRCDALSLLFPGARLLLAYLDFRNKVPRDTRRVLEGLLHVVDPVCRLYLSPKPKFPGIPEDPLDLRAMRYTEPCAGRNKNQKTRQLGEDSRETYPEPFKDVIHYSRPQCQSLPSLRGQSREKTNMLSRLRCESLVDKLDQFVPVSVPVAVRDVFRVCRPFRMSQL